MSKQSPREKVRLIFYCQLSAGVSMQGFQPAIRVAHMNSADLIYGGVA